MPAWGAPGREIAPDPGGDAGEGIITPNFQLKAAVPSSTGRQ